MKRVILTLIVGFASLLLTIPPILSGLELNAGNIEKAISINNITSITLSIATALLCFFLAYRYYKW